jgi:hypothetical protein
MGVETALACRVMTLDKNILKCARNVKDVETRLCIKVTQKNFMPFEWDAVIQQ